MYLWQREREGAELAEVAMELGVEAATLRRWAQRWPTGKEVPSAERMVPVVVTADSRAAAEVATGAVVHGPRGLRIEGLTMAQIAELMEALAC